MAEQSERGLELAAGTLPSARSIAAELKSQLNAAILAERARRGVVQMPEDTWAMHRSLARVIETCGEYGRAFTAAAKEARQVAEEELITAVGEQEGQPNQGMTVPDADGDVVIGLDTVNTHTYDPDALFAAVAFEVIESMDVVKWVRSIESGTMDSDVADGLASMLVLALQRLTELGKFEPQVTKVNKFTSELARMGGTDGVVSSVTSSHTVRSVYKGVKVERKETKPRRAK